jgi:hypothetical protein
MLKASSDRFGLLRSNALQVTLDVEAKLFANIDQLLGLDIELFRQCQNPHLHPSPSRRFRRKRSRLAGTPA